MGVAHREENMADEVTEVEAGGVEGEGGVGGVGTESVYIVRL